MQHRIHHPGPFNSELFVSGSEFHHAARVARVRPGERVELFDGRGNAAAGLVEEIERDQMRIRVTDSLPSRETPLRLTLAMAIIHLDKFELVLQKATELGAQVLTPLVTDRVEVRPERYRGKGERWEKIIFEAVKQSGRSMIPRLDPSSSFDEVIGRDGVKILFDLDAADGEPLPEAGELTLLIGPEGGWSERETALARERQCRFERLGPRRLRAETAAIAAVAIITARSGGM